MKRINFSLLATVFILGMFTALAISDIGKPPHMTKVMTTWGCVQVISVIVSLVGLGGASVYEHFKKSFKD